MSEQLGNGFDHTLTEEELGLQIAWDEELPIPRLPPRLSGDAALDFEWEQIMPEVPKPGSVQRKGVVKRSLSLLWRVTSFAVRYGSVLALGLAIGAAS